MMLNSPPLDSLLCPELPPRSMTYLTFFLCLGTFVSYLPQHAKILSMQSSEGFSPYYILMGTIGATSNITNMILLQFRILECCAVQSAGECFVNVLGIVQVGIQWLMFVGIFVLYVAFFPQQNKYISSASPRVNEGYDSEEDEEEGPVTRRWWDSKYTQEWRTVVFVVCAVIAHHIICVVLSALLIIKLGPRSAPTLTWAGFLGIFSLVLTCIQFIPQIVRTWRRKRVGALSIPMMLMQTPGGYLFAYSVAIRPGVNWSSWISTFVAATLQGVLLVICIAWWLREKQEASILTEIHEQPSAQSASNEEAHTETEPLMPSRQA